jgi:hypothetical protein
MVIDAVIEQPFASVTVYVRAPAIWPLMVPVPVMIPVPPVAVTMTTASPVPHPVSVAIKVALALIAEGCVMVKVLVLEHPRASVTMKDWLPAARCIVPVPVYGAVPPEPLTVTVAVPPLHAIGVVREAAATSADGWVMLRDVELVHPLASVTVKVWLPAGRCTRPIPAYGAVPPEAEMVTLAFPPLQAMGLVMTAETDGGLGTLTVTLAVAVPGEAQEALLVNVTDITSPLFRLDDVYVLPVPTLVPFQVHAYVGNAPPLVGVAVKVTGSPEHEVITGEGVMFTAGMQGGGGV